MNLGIEYDNQKIFSNFAGKKRHSMATNYKRDTSNHSTITCCRFHDALGNVMATILDRRQPYSSGNDAYMPYIVSTTDYYPFGYPISNRSTNTGGYRYLFNGQEGDNEVFGEVANFGYEFRQYDSRLARWWSVDPKWNEYPGISPYVFCNGSPIVLMDMKGKDSSPIYDLQGNFLGTDNEGLQGEKILMHKDHFKQGMDHNAAKQIEAVDRGMFEVSTEAEGRSSYHHDMLPNRPDWDGVVTIAEGIAWAKSHAFAKYGPTPDNTLYLDASKLDFGSLSVSNIGLKEGESEIKNLYSYVNPLSQASIRTTYALGNTQIKLIDECQGLVQLFSDTYDWDYHNAFVNGIPQGKRDMLIYFERIRINVNDAHGFPIKFYGIGKIKTR